MAGLDTSPAPVKMELGRKCFLSVPTRSWAESQMMLMWADLSFVYQDADELIHDITCVAFKSWGTSYMLPENNSFHGKGGAGVWSQRYIFKFFQSLFPDPHDTQALKILMPSSSACSWGSLGSWKIYSNDQNQFWSVIVEDIPEVLCNKNKYIVIIVRGCVN